MKMPRTMTIQKCDSGSPLVTVKSKTGRKPKIYDAIQSAVIAEAIVLSSTSVEKLLCNSSSENTTPANGALKAAARPAPAPQVISSFSSVRKRLFRREKPLPTIAPS